MIFKLEYDSKIDNYKNANSYNYSSLDNEESVFFDICSVFDESKAVSFFALDPKSNSFKKMDLVFDLAVVFSQIVGMCSTWKNNSWDAKIDFFEQGTDLTYQFTEVDDTSLEINILNFLTNENLGNIKATKKDAISSVKGFVGDFMKIGNSLCPDLLKEDIFTSWLESTEQNNYDERNDSE